MSRRSSPQLPWECMDDDFFDDDNAFSGTLDVSDRSPVEAATTRDDEEEPEPLVTSRRSRAHVPWELDEDQEGQTRVFHGERLPPQSKIEFETVTRTDNVTSSYCYGFSDPSSFLALSPQVIHLILSEFFELILTNDYADHTSNADRYSRDYDDNYVAPRGIPFSDSTNPVKLFYGYFAQDRVTRTPFLFFASICFSDESQLHPRFIPFNRILHLRLALIDPPPDGEDPELNFYEDFGTVAILPGVIRTGLAMMLGDDVVCPRLRSVQGIDIDDVSLAENTLCGMVGTRTESLELNVSKEDFGRNSDGVVAGGVLLRFLSNVGSSIQSLRLLKSSRVRRFDYGLRDEEMTWAMDCRPESGLDFELPSLRVLELEEISFASFLSQPHPCIHTITLSSVPLTGPQIRVLSSSSLPCLRHVSLSRLWLHPGANVLLLLNSTTLRTVSIGGILSRNLDTVANFEEVFIPENSNLVRLALRSCFSFGDDDGHRPFSSRVVRFGSEVAPSFPDDVLTLLISRAVGLSSISLEGFHLRESELVVDAGVSDALLRVVMLRRKSVIRSVDFTALSESNILTLCELGTDLESIVLRRNHGIASNWIRFLSLPSLRRFEFASSMPYSRPLQADYSSLRLSVNSNLEFVSIRSIDPKLLQECCKCPKLVHFTFMNYMETVQLSNIEFMIKNCPVMSLEDLNYRFINVRRFGLEIQKIFLSNSEISSQQIAFFADFCPNVTFFNAYQTSFKDQFDSLFIRSKFPSLEMLYLNSCRFRGGWERTIEALIEAVSIDDVAPVSHLSVRRVYPKVPEEFVRQVIRKMDSLEKLSVDNDEKQFFRVLLSDLSSVVVQ